MDSARGLLRPYDAQLTWTTRLVDMLLVAVMLVVGLAVYGYPWSERYTLVLAVALVLFSLCAESLRVYRSWRSEPLTREAQYILMAWIVTAAGILILGYATKVTHQYSRLAIGTWVVTTPIALFAMRGLVRIGLHTLRKQGRNTRSVAIVGAGALADHINGVIARSPWMGLRLLGVYDDPAAGDGESHATVKGSIDELFRLQSQSQVDVVYVTIPLHDEERITTVLERLADTTVSVYVVPEFFLFDLFHGQWVQLGGVPMVSVFETPFFGVDGLFKRIEDIVVASLALVLVSIPMLLIGIGVKLTSPGPTLFKQRRYGLDGSEFRVYKFRTMTVQEDDRDLRQATRGDPRVTRFGAFLRRTSLDELPQFLNVLQGTMSVVGPRPHAVAHNESYRKLISGYMVRHKVKPGITGWAQVNGYRGETGTLDKMEKRVEYDLWYIRNWSLLLDIRIIGLTVLRGFVGPGAY